MPTSKRTSRYPGAYIDYFEAAFKSGLRLTCPNKAKANNLRLRLYGLREALRAEGHPHLFFADSCVIRIIDNDVILTRADSIDDIVGIQTLDAASGALPRVDQPLLYRPVQPAVIPPAELERVSESARIQAEDPMESALRKMGIFKAVEERERLQRLEREAQAQKDKEKDS